MRLFLPLILAGGLLLGACAPPPSFSVDPNQAAFPVQPKPKPTPRSNALPLRTDVPNQILVVDRPADDVMNCLENQIKTTFRLPESFVGHRTYDHHAYSVGLINPITKRMGITLDITRNTPASSTVKLYANGSELSRVWLNLPKKCQ